MRAPAARRSRTAATSRDAPSARRCVDLALDTWGRLDIVVNNAGFGRPRMVFNLADDEWDDVVRVHLRGHVRRSPPRVPLLARAGEAARVDLRPPHQYHHRPAGVRRRRAVELRRRQGRRRRFTEAVATEMAPYGVTVNTIMPWAMTRLAPSAGAWRDRSRRRRCRSTRPTPCTSPSSAATSRTRRRLDHGPDLPGPRRHRRARRAWQVRDTSIAPTAASPPPTSRRAAAPVRRRRQTRRPAAPGVASVAGS